MPHILITGANGQLGQALASCFSSAKQLTCWTRPRYDITDPAIADAVAETKPDVVVNAAAWTDVDGAEKSPQFAFNVNALGPKYLAEGCARCGGSLVQISSNEVFAGEPGRFYHEYDQTSPGSVYSRSKAAGEVAAATALDRLFIVRVAWLYSAGSNNFPAKISAAADRHGSLRVVSDEFGNPTYAPDVAVAVAKLIETQRYGIYHLVNDGSASRYDWATELLRLTGRGALQVDPISAREWPRPTTPPPHAVLVNQAGAALGITLRDWRDALRDYVQTELNK
ncbi:MAG: dTDP-4-dehydrorhamnose reductase [Caldilineaceae bacterium SB0675_bin_29]|uniref:dTDP-4-dehydrorhamnose reductase n=1 Tax=Caldilineaceae bacterium SB0675_bin_29 TaxID=2605266 RepID=A0A6B1GC97_9CHLR|nr:dTDP-4-dehydrorhamnose reductase [Caldilineaceae bacterium SB0675_bin_29]